jgi:hypothetical protein
VDEALDQVYIAKITATALNAIYDLIHPTILKRHKRALAAFESARHALLDAPDDGNLVISAETLLANAAMTVEEADAAVVALWEDLDASKLRTKKDNRGLVREIFTAFRGHLAAYRWIEADQDDRTIFGTRLLLPPDAGQVIFDATGNLNNVYLGRPDAYEVKSLPRVRDYRTVTLRTAKTWGTGKTAFEKHGPEIFKKTLDTVLAHYGERAGERRVLAVTDKRSEPKLREAWASAGFAAFDVAHWGKIDGRNDWRDYDTLVIMGLPWGKIWMDLSTFMAVRGVELDDEGLNAPPDEVRTIRETRIAAELTQAIGRIRLRRMTNADGSCEPCDVFARFSHHGYRADADNLIAGVERTLTGVRVVPWSDGGVVRNAGRAPATSELVLSKLLAMGERLKPGEERPISRKDFNASRETIRTVLTAARRAGRPEHTAVTGAGLQVIEGGYGGRTGRTPTKLIRTR